MTANDGRKWKWYAEAERFEYSSSNYSSRILAKYLLEYIRVLAAALRITASERA